MPSFQVSEFIDRPPEETFDFATDLDKVSSWIPEIIRIERLSEGGLAPGARFAETRRINGREHTAEIQITEHERPIVHAASANCMGCLATYRYYFKPEAGGTRVELIADVTGRGLAVFIAPMMLSMMKKQDEGQLARLKAVIEAGNQKPES